MKNISVKFDENDYRELEMMAKLRYTTKAQLIRLIVKKYLIAEQKK
jgi:metal-responsive CopG/Arc/MetJ family transcriptional regulator